MIPRQSGWFSAGRGARTVNVTFELEKNGSAAAVAAAPMVSAKAAPRPGHGATMSPKAKKNRATRKRRVRLAGDTGLRLTEDDRRPILPARPSNAADEIHCRKGDENERPHVVMKKLEGRERIDADPVEDEEAHQVAEHQRRETDRQRDGLSPPARGYGEHGRREQNVGLHRVAALDDLHRESASYDVPARGHKGVEHVDQSADDARVEPQVAGGPSLDGVFVAARKVVKGEKAHGDGRERQRKPGLLVAAPVLWAVTLATLHHGSLCFRPQATLGIKRLLKAPLRAIVAPPRIIAIAAIRRKTWRRCFLSLPAVAAAISSTFTPTVLARSTSFSASPKLPCCIARLHS